MSDLPSEGSLSADTRHSLPSVENVAQRRLDNGMLLVARENFASPAVVVAGLMEAGAMDDPEEKGGLASLTASLISRGTAHYDYDSLNEAIEGVGASIATSGRIHTTAVSGKSLAEDYPTVLALIADMLRQPTFPEEQFDRVHAQRLTYLRERLTNTRAVAHLHFNEMTYPPGHPYHHPASGTVESVEGISRSDLVDFHSQVYGPNEAIFVTVGAVEKNEALDRMQEVFGDWQALPSQRGRREAPAAALPEVPLSRFTEMPGKTQSDVIYGLPTIPRMHPDFMTLQLANTVLGVFGMMGRVGRSVRDEQGLAYYARTVLDATLGPSSWRASAGVAPDKVEQAVNSIRDEWVRMGNELVGEDELNDSKSLMSGSLPLRLETNGGVARTLLDILYYQLGLDYLLHYEERIRSINAEEVRRVSQQYFDPERAILSVAGPRAE